MRYLTRLALAIASTASLLLGAPAILAHAQAPTAGADHAVFVQTNDPAGNSIAAYHRANDGSLTYVASYATGGNGGRATGAVVDPLDSQSSLVYDSAHGLLLAVNAGSDTVSVFGVSGSALHLNQVIASGGAFPASIAVRGDLAYALNSGSGSVVGYRIEGSTLHPIEGSQQALGLGNNNPPPFAPSQIGFTPDGQHLVVTMKDFNGGTVDVFGVLPSGRLSGQPTQTAVGGNAFAFVFDPAGQLVIVNAAFENLSTYTVHGDGSLSLVSAGQNDGQKAACWVTAAGGSYFAANAGSASLSSYAISTNGTVTLEKSPAATGIPGAVDMAASSDGRFLYAQGGGNGSVHGFRANADGSLAAVGAWSIPDGANQEGIAAA